jgi:hypothetical protein
MDACVRQLQTEIETDLRGPACQASALAGVETVLSHLARWVEGHLVWLGVLSDQAAGPRRGAVHCGPLYQWMHGLLRDQLERGVAMGELAVDDCVYTADALLALLDAGLYQYQSRERGYTPEQILAGMCRLLRALCAPVQTPSTPQA